MIFFGFILLFHTFKCLNLYSIQFTYSEFELLSQNVDVIRKWFEIGINNNLIEKITIFQWNEICQSSKIELCVIKYSKMCINFLLFLIHSSK